jgi:hypothetical protein
MFRVLVLGGIALVGGSACGGSPDVQTYGGGQWVPPEPRVPAEPVVSSPADAGTPSETNASAVSDAAPEVGPEAGGPGDAAPEGSSDAADSAACTPYEMTIGGECFPIEGPQ